MPLNGSLWLPQGGPLGEEDQSEVSPGPWPPLPWTPRASTRPGRQCAEDRPAGPLWQGLTLSSRRTERWRDCFRQLPGQTQGWSSRPRSHGGRASSPGGGSLIWAAAAVQWHSGSYFWPGEFQPGAGPTGPSQGRAVVFPRVPSWLGFCCPRLFFPSLGACSTLIWGPGWAGARPEGRSSHPARPAPPPPAPRTKPA